MKTFPLVLARCLVILGGIGIPGALYGLVVAVSLFTHAIKVAFQRGTMLWEEAGFLSLTVLAFIAILYGLLLWYGSIRRSFYEGGFPGGWKHLWIGTLLYNLFLAVIIGVLIYLNEASPAYALLTVPYFLISLLAWRALQTEETAQ
ncbi:MAG: hypothetical protein SFY92_01680 [Verrucomicrobiae bacterium]|nr:hypothetical protein [Verrucomicrobiae bacterium]